MPIFSVIIPAYNSEKFISGTVESVLNQTFTDFELIIVDDGSTDTTTRLVSMYQEKDSRVKLFSIPNSKGPVTPTNIGIASSSGTYITFLDHDDSWKKNKLETLYKEFTKNKEVGFILSNVETFFKTKNRCIPSKAKISDGGLPLENILSGDYFNTFSMMAIKREVLDKVGELDKELRIFADYDLVIRMVSLNVPHIFLKESLVVYMIHSTNMSSLTASSLRRAEDLDRIINKNSMIFINNKGSLSKVQATIGSLYLYSNKKREAIKYYKKALMSNPWNFMLYVKIVFAYLFGNFYFSILNLRTRLYFYTR